MLQFSQTFTLVDCYNKLFSLKNCNKSRYLKIIVFKNEEKYKTPRLYVSIDSYGKRIN